MKFRPKRTTGFALAQLLLMAAVVASFVADSASDIASSSAMARRMSDMADNAMPSVQALTQARGQVKAIENVLRQPVGGTPRSDGRLGAFRQGLASDVTTYFALPPFPGERELAATMVDTRIQFDRALDDTLAAYGSGDVAAQHAGVDRVSRSADALDLALENLVTFNAVEGERVAAEARSVERQGVVRGIVVDALVTLLALVATVFSAFTWRRAAIEQQGHIAELEIFAGRVAHDLRNPLGGLSMRLALMKAGVATEPEKVRYHLEKAVQAVGRLNLTIDALLEFARAGGHPPADAHAELGEALDRVVDDLRPAAQTARAALTVDSFRRPLEVACAPGVLASVLSNLIGNAVKYIVEGRSPKREIVVHVEDRASGVRVEVEDTGPGLTSEAKERLFEPFVRPTATAQPGFGLGLATVKRIVESFGGRVGVRSVLGEGSTFWFQLPKAEKTTS